MSPRREEWRKRVERFVDSGLTAEEFATEMGLNVGTLRHWKYTFDREAKAKQRPGRPAPRRDEGAQPRTAAPPLPLVEVRSTASMDARFELELSRGRRVRVPASFEADALRRLLGVLEEVA